MYLNSTSVKVFPLAKYRGKDSGDITSRIFYEQNVSNIIRQLIDTDGFIISGSINSGGIVSDGNFCFNLYGYYFDILSGTSIIDTTLLNTIDTSITTVYVYASIVLSESEPKELQGQDVNTEYQGLSFVVSTEKKFSTANEKILNILVGTRKGDSWDWKIDNTSYFRFDVSALSIEGIDGKYN